MSRSLARLLARLGVLVALMLAFAARPALAQVNGSTDILTGLVKGPNGQPLVGARVEATSVETGVTRTKTTNDKGRFTLLFPDGGGQYTVTVRYVGMAARRVTLARQADEDRLEVNVTLTQATQQLEAVVVQGQTRQAPRANDPRPTPGSTERTMSGEQLQRLPIDPTDATAIALLSPGVVSVAGSDTTSAGVSVAGQRPDQNLVTLDGLSFGSGSVPQEAVRSTRVVTNTFDVGRGQFTGGEVATTTRGGTNQVSGSFGFNVNDPRLQFIGDDSLQGTSLAQGYTQHQLSGGLGGPIVKDRAFWFGSVQLRRRADPLQSLLDMSGYTLRQLGTSADSASRFLSLVQGYGIPLTTSGLPDDRLADNVSGITRLDWHLGENHTLMLRGNGQTGLQQASGIGSLALPSRGSEQRTWGAGGMMTLSSVLGSFLNEGRAFYAVDGRNADPYLDTPAGQVRVSSQLADGTTAVTALDFGGTSGAVTSSRNSQLELTDELSWLSGGGGHRFKLGGLLNYTDFSTASAANRLGTFTFNSLEDFDANRPAQFTRTLTPRQRTGSTATAAVYLGDTWRYTRALQLTYGVRAEYGAYLQSPAYNAEVEQLFGRRTDRFPTDLAITPRVGFTWMLGLPDQQQQGQQGQQGERRGDGPPQGGFGGRGGFGGPGGGFGGPGGGGGFGGGQGGGPGGQRVTIVRGGIGEFRGRSSTQLFSSAIDATGLPGAQGQLVCIGDQVPVPNWAAYLADPSSVPTTCADGGVGGIGGTSAQRQSVSVFDPDFVAPRTWRGTLGVQRRVGARYGFSFDLAYALGLNASGARDLNLASSPAFSLATEGGRPVYVPASTIAPTTGATSVLASRLHPEFAQVMEQRSDLTSRTAQATLGVNGVLPFTNLLWNLSYSFMRSRDQTAFASGGAGGFGAGGPAFGGAGAGFGFGQATTAGNPNAVEWGTSDLERRHSINGTLSWYAKPWLDVTSIVRLSSGTPYSPRVGGDINGDGARNDRAFIYDAANSPDTAIANGMSRLLANAPERARECLLAQQGTVAGRNSCRTGWYPSLDFQANIRPDLGPVLGRRLTFNVSLVNPLVGLDQMLHGSSDLRGWGQPSNADATLLYVTGFDAASSRYRYQVNERFGSTQSSRLTIRNPFQIAIQARLQVGPDRQREMLQAMLQGLNGRGGQATGGGAGGPGGPGGPGGGAGGPGGFNPRTMLERIAPNPASQILAYRDSVGLTDEQVARLTTIGDSVVARNEAIVAQLQSVAEKELANRNGTPQAVFQAMQPRLQEARNAYVAAIAQAKAVLTPAQWEKLPESLRNPSMRGPGGRGGPGGPPGR